MMGGMSVTNRRRLPAVIANIVRAATTGRHRGPKRHRLQILFVTSATAIALALAPGSAFAAAQPSMTITLFDDQTVVVGGASFPANSDVTLTADLVYTGGTAYSGVGTVHANPFGHFIVGFRLPEYPRVAALITVKGTANGVSSLPVSLVIGPGTFPLNPASSNPATPTPSASASASGGGGGGGAPPPTVSDNAVSSCPSGDQLTGAPGGNTFSGHTYNGHGQTLPQGNYTIDSNTCVENFVFDGSNLTLKGTPSNVTIVNNTFQNWPAKQAIANVNGTNINVNYNTVKNTAGGAWTGIFGQGTMTNVSVSHNDIQNIGAAVDGIQLRFTGIGTNVSVSYNRITNNGRFPIELQQVVHGLKVLHNYATVRSMGADTGGQISVAVGNDKDGGGYYDSDTSGVEVAYNIVLNTDAGATGACLESRGNGNVLHNNFCSNFQFINDYAMTNNSQPNPWYVKDNILLGPGSGAFSTYEGFNRSGYQPVHPTETGNQRFSMSDPNKPPVPAWNYRAGAQ